MFNVTEIGKKFKNQIILPEKILLGHVVFFVAFGHIGLELQQILTSFARKNLKTREPP